MDPDLPEVRVAALLVIRRDGDLHHERPNIAVMQITEVDRLPTGRLVQLLHLDLLPVMQKNEICIICTSNTLGLAFSTG